MKTNWEEIKQKYITSDVSCKELASEFNVNANTVSTRCRSEKWGEERNKYKQKLTKKIQEGVADEIAEAYKEVVMLAKKELVEETKLLIEIRKNIKETDQYAESRVNKCSMTVKDILNTLEHHAYPQREDKKDNNITVVLGDEKIKEYVK